MLVMSEKFCVSCSIDSATERKHTNNPKPKNQNEKQRHKDNKAEFRTQIRKCSPLAQRTVERV